MFDRMDFQNKHYLVTGASSGIGRAVSVELSKRGAHVALLSRDARRLEETLASLAPGEHSVLRHDLVNTEEIKDVLAPLLSADARISGFVHCAGISPVIPLRRLTFARLNKMMLINFYSFVEITRCLCMAKKEDHPMRIVGLSSIASVSNSYLQTAYAASKAAMDAAVRWLSVELAEKRVNINTICPAYVDTEMLEDITTLVDGFIENLGARGGQSLGLIDPRDVAQMVLYLLSDFAKSITGMQIPINAGVGF